MITWCSMCTYITLLQFTHSTFYFHKITCSKITRQRQSTSCPACHIFIFAIYEVVCDQLSHSRLCDQMDIFVTHLIFIIKSKYQYCLFSYFSVVVCLRGSTIICHWSFICLYPRDLDFVSIITVQSMVRANTWIHLSLNDMFVYLHNTQYHYHHYANLSEWIERKNALQVCSSECLGLIQWS